MVVAFASWMLVYGHAPLLHALLGTDACVNQRTGAPLKWYIESADGEITLFDSGGYDSATGVEKRPATPEICAAYARQKVNARPRRITANVRSIEFFDPNNGRPRVWYSKGPDGAFNLFDARGFDPVTSAPLLPVTKDVVAEITAHAAAGAARQRAAQEHARLAAEQAQLAASHALQINPHCNWKSYLITVTPDKLTPRDPDNPDILDCKIDLVFKSPSPSRCYYVRIMGEEKERTTKYCDRDGALLVLPNDVVAIRSAEGPLIAKVTLRPPQ